MPRPQWSKTQRAQLRRLHEKLRNSCDTWHEARDEFEKQAAELLHWSKDGKDWPKRKRQLGNLFDNFDREAKLRHRNGAKDAAPPPPTSGVQGSGSTTEWERLSGDHHRALLGGNSPLVGKLERQMLALYYLDYEKLLGDREAGKFEEDLRLSVWLKTYDKAFPRPDYKEIPLREYVERWGGKVRPMPGKRVKMKDPRAGRTRSKRLDWSHYEGATVWDPIQEREAFDHPELYDSGVTVWEDDSGNFRFRMRHDIFDIWAQKMARWSRDRESRDGR